MSTLKPDVVQGVHAVCQELLLALSSQLPASTTHPNMHLETLVDKLRQCSLLATKDGKSRHNLAADETVELLKQSTDACYTLAQELLQLDSYTRYETAKTQTKLEESRSKHATLQKQVDSLTQENADQANKIAQQLKEISDLRTQLEEGLAEINDYKTKLMSPDQAHISPRGEGNSKRRLSGSRRFSVSLAKDFRSRSAFSSAVDLEHFFLEFCKFDPDNGGEVPHTVIPMLAADLGSDITSLPPFPDNGPPEMVSVHSCFELLCGTHKSPCVELPLNDIYRCYNKLKGDGLFLNPEQFALLCKQCGMEPINLLATTPEKTFNFRDCVGYALDYNRSSGGFKQLKKRVPSINMFVSAFREFMSPNGRVEAERYPWFERMFWMDLSAFSASVSLTFVDLAAVLFPRMASGRVCPSRLFHEFCTMDSNRGDFITVDNLCDTTTGSFLPAERLHIESTLRDLGCATPNAVCFSDYIDLVSELYAQGTQLNTISLMCHLQTLSCRGRRPVSLSSLNLMFDCHCDHESKRLGFESAAHAISLLLPHRPTIQTQIIEGWGTARSKTDLTFEDFVSIVIAASATNIGSVKALFDGMDKTGVTRSHVEASVVESHFEPSDIRRAKLQFWKQQQQQSQTETLVSFGIFASCVWDSKYAGPDFALIDTDESETAWHVCLLPDKPCDNDRLQQRLGELSVHCERLGKENKFLEQQVEQLQKQIHDLSSHHTSNDQQGESSSTAKSDDQSRVSLILTSVKAEVDAISKASPRTAEIENGSKRDGSTQTCFVQPCDGVSQDELENSFLQVQQRCENAEAELLSAKQALYQALTEKHRVDQELARSKTQMDQLIQQTQILIKELENVTKELENMEQTTAYKQTSTTSDNKAFLEEVKRLRQLNDETNDRLNESKTEIVRLKQELEIAIHNRTQLQDEKDTLNQELARKRQDIVELQARMRQVQKKQEDTKANDESDQAKAAKALEQQLTNEQLKVAALEQQLLQEQGKATGLGKQLTAEQAKAESLGQQLLQEQGKASSLGQQLLQEQTKAKTLEQHLQQEQGKATALGQQLRAEQTKASSLDQKFSQEQSKASTLGQQLSQEQTKAKALEHELQQARAATTHAQQELQQIRHQGEFELAKRVAENEDLKERITKLAANLAANQDATTLEGNVRKTVEGISDVWAKSLKLFAAAESRLREQSSRVDHLLAQVADGRSRLSTPRPAATTAAAEAAGEQNKSVLTKLRADDMQLVRYLEQELGASNARAENLSVVVRWWQKTIQLQGKDTSLRLPRQPGKGSRTLVTAVLELDPLLSSFAKAADLANKLRVNATALQTLDAEIEKIRTEVQRKERALLVIQGKVRQVCSCDSDHEIPDSQKQQLDQLVVERNTLQTAFETGLGSHCTQLQERIRLLDERNKFQSEFRALVSGLQNQQLPHLNTGSFLESITAASMSATPQVELLAAVPAPHQQQTQPLPELTGNAVAVQQCGTKLRQLMADHMHAIAQNFVAKVRQCMEMELQLQRCSSDLRGENLRQDAVLAQEQLAQVRVKQQEVKNASSGREEFAAAMKRLRQLRDDRLEVQIEIDELSIQRKRLKKSSNRSSTDGGGGMERIRVQLEETLAQEERLTADIQKLTELVESHKALALAWYPEVLTDTSTPQLRISVADGVDLVDQNKSLEDFDTIEVLRDTGCSRVVHVVDNKGDHWVIKEVAKTSQLEREATRLYRLRHCLVARLESVFSDGKRMFLQLPFYSKGSMRPWVNSMASKQGDLDPTEVAEVRSRFRQILQAVAFVHQHGVVHRDLKPENILIDDLDRVVLCDFGISHDQFDKYGATTTVVGGTPRYAPPNFQDPTQRRGLHACGFDMFAIGVMMAEVLIGNLPPNNNNLQRWVLDVCGREKSKTDLATCWRCDLLTEAANCLRSKAEERPAATELLAAPAFENVPVPQESTTSQHVPVAARLPERLTALSLYLYNLRQDQKRRFPIITIDVRKDNIAEDAIRAFKELPNADLLRVLQFNLDNGETKSLAEVTRGIWQSALQSENGLFEQAGSGMTIMQVRYLGGSAVDRLFQRCWLPRRDAPCAALEGLGRFLIKCLLEGVHVPVRFSAVVLSALVTVAGAVPDMFADTHTCLNAVREFDPQRGERWRDLTMTRRNDAKPVTLELLLDDAETFPPVPEANFPQLEGGNTNKQRVLKAASKYYLFDMRQEQIAAMQKGFSSIVDVWGLVALLTGSELGALLFGPTFTDRNQLKESLTILQNQGENDAQATGHLRQLVAWLRKFIDDSSEMAVRMFMLRATGDLSLLVHESTDPQDRATILVTMKDDDGASMLVEMIPSARVILLPKFEAYEPLAAAMSEFLLQASASAPEVKAVSCVICRDDCCMPKDGVFCGDGDGKQQPDAKDQHFVCNDCFDNYVATESEKDLYILQQRDGGKVFCPEKNYGCQGSAAFSDQLIAARVTAATFQKFLTAKQSVKEQHLVQELEQQFEERLKREVAKVENLDGNDKQVHALRLRIVNEVLTLRCPRANCGAAFLDFTGCLAVTCHRCKCGFCGLCQVDCGHDAHSHAVRCHDNPRPGQVFLPTDVIREVHTKIRQRKLKEFLQKNCHDANMKRKLVDALKNDLRDLGLRAPA